MESINETKINADQLNVLIASRRSIFTDQFIPGKAIPDDIIRQLLENANWAPTHKLTEPWRFTVFSGKGLQKLAEFQAGLYKETAGAKFKQDKYEKLLRTPGQCSHVIALGMKRSTGINIPEMEEIAAVAAAVQNIYLSTVAYGIGGYWSTGGITYEEEAKSFFGLGGQDRLMGFFYLGYIQIPAARGSRRPVAEKTTWVKE